MNASPSSTPTLRPVSQLRAASNPFALCEQQFVELLESGDVDFGVMFGCLPDGFEASIEQAMTAAFTATDTPRSRAARTALQRILYRINRLKLFWYDELDQYYNENSRYLHELHTRIEDAWYGWEIAQIRLPDSVRKQPRASLIECVERDRAQVIDAAGRYFRDYADHAAYRRLMQIQSLEAVIETSQLARHGSGSPNSIQGVLAGLMVEEYNGGERRSVSSYRAMLRELDMNTQAEAYLQLLPWETLSRINLGFMQAERTRYFLRNIGGLLYNAFARTTEFGSYDAAARRLGLHPHLSSYWQIQTEQDRGKGDLILQRVAQPLMDRYPQVAWEMVLGYEHRRLVATRARQRIYEEAQLAQASTVMRSGKRGFAHA